MLDQCIPGSAAKNIAGHSHRGTKIRRVARRDLDRKNIHGMALQQGRNKTFKPRGIHDKFSKNAVFILADQDGFPRKELKKLKSLGNSVKVGKETYFASQVVTIVNNELDRQGI